MYMYNFLSARIHEILLSLYNTELTQIDTLFILGMNSDNVQELLYLARLSILLG